MEMSLPKILLILILILVVFGAGKLPKVMEELGKGLKSFKKAMHDESDTPAQKIEEAKTPEKSDKSL